MVGHGLCASWDTLRICNETTRGVGLLHQIYDPRSGHVAVVSNSLLQQSMLSQLGAGQSKAL